MTLIRQWKEDSYKLQLFNYNVAYSNKLKLIYHFYHEDKLIFEGSNFKPSPLHSVSSDKTLAALLSFLSLKPGDTDKEYFEDYTQEQLDFVKKHGEYLALFADELENK